MEHAAVQRVRQLFFNIIFLPVSILTYLTNGKTVQQSLPAPETTVPCRFRLDNDSSATLDLPDGRNLGYAQYGALTGHPILYLHGLPGSRVEAAALDDKAKSLDLRIIAVDRPGYGWSSAHPNRKILDHLKDIEYLTEHLKLTHYGALGISGGGPYSLAAAYALPADKLRAVSIVCGLAPPDAGYSGQNWFHWAGFTVGWRYLPSLCKWWFSFEPAAQLHLSPEERLQLFMENVEKGKAKAHPKDLAFFEDIDRMRLFIFTASEAYKQGLDGMCQDGSLSASPFDFRVEDIRKDLPVQLWYGSLDTNVPPQHGDYIKRMVGEEAVLRLEEETHASIYLNCQDEWLEALAEAVKA